MDQPKLNALRQRYDSLEKVTGRARYAADFREPFDQARLAYACLVQSTIPCGSVREIDATVAERSPGVLAVLTPQRAPRLPASPPGQRSGRAISLLQDNDVHYSGQPIAVVVARSLQEARYAAGRLQVSYTERPALLGLRAHAEQARAPKQRRRADAGSPTRGDVEAAWAAAEVRVDEVYETPIQNHNPMEPHATVAWWEDGALRLYDSTQSIGGVQDALAQIFGLEREQVRVQCPYTGGGFGCKGAAWSHVPLAAMAASVVGRPVKLVIERGQMFGPVGARPATINHIRLGARGDGRLLCVRHDALVHTSVMEDFVEVVADPSRMLYACEANACNEQLVDLNLGVATYTRGPGKTSGTAVLEIAMDELAEKLKIDPLELRLRNYAETDTSTGKPWTSKHLRECYEQGARKFGWTQRPAVPRQWIEGNELVGYGMATATYPGHRTAASAEVKVLADETASVASGTQELGTGTYTILAQTAAAVLGIDWRRVRVLLGDSSLPRAPGSSSSQTTASVMPAVEAAARVAKKRLIALATTDAQCALHGASMEDVEMSDGRLFLRADESRGERIAKLMQRHSSAEIAGQASTRPDSASEAASCHSFGAVFAEVGVDRDLGTTRVRRIVGVYDVGRMLNATTGLQQLRGGVIWGIGFALLEEAVIDPVYGRTANENLADYHVPVQLDVGKIEVSVLNLPDPRLSALGARGMGEIGATGTPAAIANAVYHATGKRIRSYPITLDKLIKA